MAAAGDFGIGDCIWYNEDGFVRKVFIGTVLTVYDHKAIEIEYWSEGGYLVKKVVPKSCLRKRITADESFGTGDRVWYDEDGSRAVRSGMMSSGMRFKGTVLAVLSREAIKITYRNDAGYLCEKVVPKSFLRIRYGDQV